MELEQRILADCLNRLLDSLNRLTTLLVTATLTVGAAVISQSLFAGEKMLAIYSYRVPLFVASLVLGSLLVYFRTDILDKFVLLRQVITEQKASSAFSGTVIPYHSWRYNPIFPAGPSFAATRIGRVESFFWIYEFATVLVAHATFQNFGFTIGTAISILSLKYRVGKSLYREIRESCHTLYPRWTPATTSEWVYRVYIIPLIAATGVTLLLVLGLYWADKNFLMMK